MGMLKPDLGKVIFFAIGAVLGPKVIRMVRG